MKTLKQSEVRGIIKKMGDTNTCIVILGAGISVSCGIPDFRSNTGLFKNAKHGKDLFSSSILATVEGISIFYKEMAKLKVKCDQTQPSFAHHYLKELFDQKKLLRIYTQNIDGMESRVGLDVGYSVDSQVVPLHGELSTLNCNKCGLNTDFSGEVLKVALDGQVPECKKCQSNQTASSDLRRSERQAKKIGKLMTNIILYNAIHPTGDLIGELLHDDLQKKPSICLVIGTSLKIPNVKNIVDKFSECGTAIYIVDPNENPIKYADVFLKSSADSFSRRLKYIKKSQCSICGEFFRRKESQDMERFKKLLDNHRATHQVGLDERTCRICERVYSTIGALNRHLKKNKFHS